MSPLSLTELEGIEVIGRSVQSSTDLVPHACSRGNKHPNGVTGLMKAVVLPCGDLNSSIAQMVRSGVLPTPFIGPNYNPADGATYAIFRTPRGQMEYFELAQIRACNSPDRKNLAGQRAMVAYIMNVVNLTKTGKFLAGQKVKCAKGTQYGRPTLTCKASAGKAWIDKGTPITFMGKAPAMRGGQRAHG